MNILFLSELFPPHGGGAEQATYLYAKLLTESGFNVIVITNKFAGESNYSLESVNFHVYRLDLFGKYDSVRYSVLFRPDVLISSFMIKLMGWADVVYIPRIWYSAIPFAKSHKKPVIVHLHDYAPICPLSSIYDASKNTLCENKFPLCSMKCIYVSEKKRGRNVLELLSSVALNSTLAHTLGMSVVLSDAIICVSNRQRDLISERFSLLKPKISVVYNPIAELPETKATGDDFGYFGGSLLSKGIQILYKAAASLDHNKLKLRIHATNFGKLSDDTIHSFKKVGIIPYRRLVSSPLDRLYDKLRAVIIPSIAPETFSYVACEAALRGKLVIASKIGAIPEFLNGSSGAFFFDSQNHLQLAERLVYVNGLRREIAVDLGSKNREILSRRLNNKTTIERFIRVCEKVSK